MIRSARGYMGLYNGYKRGSLYILVSRTIQTLFCMDFGVGGLLQRFGVFLSLIILILGSGDGFAKMRGVVEEYPDRSQSSKRLFALESSALL